jgi:hypothetical protein
MDRSTRHFFADLLSTAACRVAVLLAGMLLVPTEMFAQGTMSDYQRALSLRDTLGDKLHNVPGDPHWLEQSPHFWYRRSVKGGNAFVLVNAAQRQKQPAFDHDRLATTLSDSIEGESFSGTTLPFRHFQYTEGRQAIKFEAVDAAWRCSLGSRCSSTSRVAKRRSLTTRSSRTRSTCQTTRSTRRT